MKKMLRLFISIPLVFIGSLLQAADFTVDNLGDNDNGQPYTTSDGTNTLRKCIRLAQNTPGANNIFFALAPAPSYQINVTGGAYNLYTGSVTIDATTIPGWSPAHNPLVVLRGNGGGSAFDLNGGRLTLKGFIFQSFQTGILVNNNVPGHVIENCWFGLDITGNSITGNSLSEYGIFIRGGSANNLIGSTTILDNSTRCVFAGCGKAGIFMEGAGTNNIVSNCYVGTNAAGDAGLGNGGNEPQNHHGIDINNTSNASVLNSVISFNTGAGIEIRGGANGTIVKANKIGTDATGNFPLGNKAVGIRIRHSNNHVIGGATAADRNIISANGSSSIPHGTSAPTQYDWYNMCGVYLEDVSNTTISGNYIGTSANGNTATAVVANDLGNFYTGVKFVAWGTGSRNNTVGGNTPAEGNVIGGNGHRGFETDAAFPGHGVQFQTNQLGRNENNYVYNNFIGIGANGVANIGNKQDGVSLFDNVRRIYIGGENRGNVLSFNTFGVFIQNNCQENYILGNKIGTDETGTLPAGNLDAGVCLQWTSNGNFIGRANAGEGNLISGNAGGVGVLFRQGGSGVASNNTVYNNIIGLQADGVTPMAATNAVGIQIEGGSSSNIIGGAGALQRNIISGNAQQGILLDNGLSNTIQGNYIGLDANGAAAGNGLNGISLLNGSAGNTIGGTAAGTGNVISANTANGIYIEGNTTIRNTIDNNRIGTNVAGDALLSNGNNGIWIRNVVTTAANRNIIGSTTAGNLISGNNEMGIKLENAPFTSVNNNKIGTNAAGTAALGNGFHGLDIIAGSNSVNVANNIISGNGRLGDAALGNGISVSASSSLTVTANKLGTDINGTSAIPNRLAGYSSTGSNNSIIGGATAAEGNIISGNGNVGVYMAAGTGNTLQNNYIGASGSGNTALGNTNQGIYLNTGANNNNFIANVISANGSDGLYLNDVSGNSFFGNFVGTGLDETVSLANTGNGFFVGNGSSGNMIGGTVDGQANVIANNTENGVVVDGATTIQNSIHKNSFFCNTARGIVLSNGGNNGYESPKLKLLVGDTIEVTAAHSSYIEIYEIDACQDCEQDDESKQLQGKKLVYSGVAPHKFELDPGKVYTSIASAGSATAGHNTSEFSSCYVLCLAALPPTSIEFSEGKVVCADFVGNITLTAVGGSTTDTVEWYSVDCGNTPIFKGNPLELPLPAVGKHYFYAKRLNSCGNSDCISDSIEVISAPVQPVSVTAPDDEFCAETIGNVALTANGGEGEELVWYSGSCGNGTPLGTGASFNPPIPTATTTYYARWEKRYCQPSACEELEITINELPEPVITGGSTICRDSIQVFSTPSNVLSTYVWQLSTTGTGSITNGQNDHEVTVNVGSANSDLRVIETTTKGCSTEVEVRISVVQPHGPQALAGGNQQLCVTNSRMAANDVPGVWSVVNGTANFSPDVYTYNAQVTGLSEGLNTLRWIVEGTCGYADTSEVVLQVGTSNLWVTGSTSNELYCIGTPKVLDVQGGGIGSGDYSYIWTTSANPHFVHSTKELSLTVVPMQAYAEYYVKIIDNQRIGCEAIDTVEVHAITGQVLTIPNLITPNGDDKNDVLEIRDERLAPILPGAYFEVMNRWGDRVYRSSDYDNTWNANGLTDGVYYYYLKTGCDNKTYKGWVQVLH
jgi:parallel beta-helix repeat protein